ncbi:tRNA (N(6)-L-threonylcarbamoyladenosine(37)-C(2))-methylthiotransferase MtaB, partial [Listeria monocytogenes]|nr:tRNA (N(6)-L-threonylcarbamoyladenosine(37)-C(2))-methylthiotransferase MtaB [Listeria monocytogenes]
MKEKVFFKTFGCRTNIYDTELLKSYVKDYEIINDENKAQIIVVNSCTVTN